MAEETKDSTSGGKEPIHVRPNYNLNWQTGTIYKTRDNRFVKITYIFIDNNGGYIVNDPEKILLDEINKPIQFWDKNGYNCKNNKDLDLVELLVKDGYGTGYKGL